MSKITEYTEATSWDDDDVIVFTDISDTSMAPSGTTKKIKKSNAISGGGGAGRVLLLDTDLTAGEADISFAAATYSALRVEATNVVGAAGATGFCYVNVYCNGDYVDANYSSHHMFGQDAIAGGSGVFSANTRLAQITGSAGSPLGAFTIDVLDLQGTTGSKYALGQAGSIQSAGNYLSTHGWSRWNNVAEITQITIRGNESATGLTGNVKIYGIP